jgi:putative transposase
MPLLVSVLLSLRSLVRSRLALHLEVLALRHQLHVLERSRRPRLRLTAAERLLWAWLSRIWTEWRPALVLVQPDTVVAWHRLPPVLDVEEPTSHGPADRIGWCPWGAPRIHGELRTLGIAVSQSTVAKYIERRRRPPSQGCRTFLANHVSQIMAADFFVVPTVTYRLLFVLVTRYLHKLRDEHLTPAPGIVWASRRVPA